MEGDTELVSVRIHHHAKHLPYYDVAMPPGASEMIREHIEWLTPVAMVTKIQESFPSVTAQQIHNAWANMSEIYWRRDDNQMKSALALLDEYPDDIDKFEPMNVPDGVEIACWGMKKIAASLEGKVVEIGLDATCKY
jgi:hypothetical protein